MANIEKLLRDHAYWADERRRLKREGEQESELCRRYQAQQSSGSQQAYTMPTSCISHVFTEVHRLNSEDPFDQFTYEEIWDEMAANDEVCEHCQNVRDLKRQRMYAGSRLGSVRAAITRVGRKLQETETNETP